MRILVLNWKDLEHPAAGGAEVFTHEVARRLVALGHEVTLLCARYPGGPAHDVRDGVRIVRRGGRFGVYRAARDFWRTEGEGRFDVVIDEINTRPFMAPRFVGSTPVVALIHQLAREVWMEETRFPVNAIGRYVLEPAWLRRYRFVPTVTVSDSTAEDLRSLGFRHVAVVPEGLPDECRTFQPPLKESKPTLLFVGRLVRTKRPADALAAFALVRRQVPDARLWIVGDGYLRSELARSSGNGITFFGRVDERTKFELLGRAHALLMPAVREGWGLVVIEANAMGTPAVGYDVPGVRDAIVHHRSGLLVGARPDALAAGALEVLGDESGTLSRGALEWSRRFDWQTTATAFLESIERARRL